MNQKSFLIVSNMKKYKLKIFIPCRWLCFCHVPHFCDSLQKHDVTAIFGQNMLKSIFSLMKQQLLDRFAAEKEKLPPETRVMVLTYFPRCVVTSIMLFCLSVRLLTSVLLMDEMTYCFLHELLNL